MKTPIAIALVAAVVVGCSPVYVSHDYDSDADFSGYKTYSWMPPEQAPRNPLEAKRMMSSVDMQLEEKGLRKVDEDPDLLVTYHTASKSITEVTDRGRIDRYGGNISTRHIEEGTLIIDLIQADSNQLVFRGMAEGAFDQKSTQKDVDKAIAKAVKKIFDKYPPK